MKKLLVLAMMATLLMAGSAFAVNRHLTPAPNATFPFGTARRRRSGRRRRTTTTRATSVSRRPPRCFCRTSRWTSPTVRRTTLFTITNVTRLPQIAHVTVWTDWSFPVLDFNIFLTGYDVQGI